MLIWQELKSLAKRPRQAQENSKPQKSGDSDSDLDSSEGSDDEVKAGIKWHDIAVNCVNTIVL